MTKRRKEKIAEYKEIKRHRKIAARFFNYCAAMIKCFIRDDELRREWCETQDKDREDEIIKIVNQLCAYALYEDVPVQEKDYSRDFVNGKGREDGK